MSGGQDWAAQVLRDDRLAAAERPEQVVMLRDDCREMIAALGVDVWRSAVAADLKRACQRTAAACDEWLAFNTRDPDQVEAPVTKWEPIAPTLAKH